MSRSRQKGDVLLESLFGVLLTAAAGAGLAHVTANLLDQKTELKLTGAALGQMRSLLEARGEALCGQTDVTLTVAERTVPVRVDCQAGPSVTVTSPAGTVALDSSQRIVLSVAPGDLGISSGARVEVGNDQ